MCPPPHSTPPHSTPPLLWRVRRETAGTSSSKYGHAKGVVGLADDGTGFWLVHSVPAFPSLAAPRVYAPYPSSGVRNGQAMLCVSLNATSIEVRARGGGWGWRRVEGEGWEPHAAFVFLLAHSYGGPCGPCVCE